MIIHFFSTWLEVEEHTKRKWSLPLQTIFQSVGLDSQKHKIRSNEMPHNECIAVKYEYKQSEPIIDFIPMFRGKMSSFTD